MVGADLTVRPCPKCELPVDPADTRNARHADHCIGETPWVLHNRQAGMVVYLSDEEYEAMIDSNLAEAAGGSSTFPEGMASEIAARALFSITDFAGPGGA